MRAPTRWSRLATAPEAVQRRVQSGIWRRYAREELRLAPAWAERLGDARDPALGDLPELTQEDLARLAPDLRPRPTPRAIRAHWPFSRKLSLTLLGKRAAALLRASYAPAHVAWLRLPDGASVAIESTGSDLDLLAELGARLVDVHGLAGSGALLLDCAPAEDFLWGAVLAPGAARAGLRVHKTGGPRVLDVEHTLARARTLEAGVLAATRAFARELLAASPALPRVHTLLLLDGPRDAELEERLRACTTPAARVCGNLAIPEARLVFPEAPEIGGFALWPDLAQVEVLDGAVLVSHLQHRGTTLARYRSGISAECIAWTTWPDGRRALARLATAP
jgi:hypothetical protein